MEILEKTKKSIAPRFLSMEVKGIEIYPAERIQSLESTRDRLQRRFPKMKFSITKFGDEHYQVIRTA